MRKQIEITGKELIDHDEGPNGALPYIFKRIAEAGAIRMKMTAQIETGGDVWQEQGKSIEDAIINAFKRRPPKHPGEIVRARVSKGPWWYMSTTTCLKRAGYNFGVKRAKD